MPSKIQTVELVNARTGGIDPVPVGREFNGQSGIVHYLEKRVNGKRVYYRPEEWRYMTDEEREAAKVEKPRARKETSTRATLSDAERALAMLSEADRAALVGKFGPKPEPAASEPAPAKPKRSRKKAAKPEPAEPSVVVDGE